MTRVSAVQRFDQARPAAGQNDISFDGRIDNRAELRAELSDDGSFNNDSQLVLAAYARWGDKAPERLVGDFAFCIWDKRNQLLFAARDVMGLRPLVYYSDSSQGVVASEPRTVVLSPGVKVAVNKRYLADYLCGTIANQVRTPFENIWRLAPGHVVKISQRGCEVSRFGYFHVNSPLHYGTDEQYAEHFREIFAQSISDRMPEQGTAAFQLSGGLDSSSIVCFSAALKERGLPKFESLRSYSLTFPGLNCDESEYIDQVGRVSGVENENCAVRMTDAASQLRFSSRRLDLPNPPHWSTNQPMLERAANAGHSVLLGGYGADEWFQGHVHQYADALVNFQWKSLLSQKSCYGQAVKHGWLKFGLRALPPESVRRIVRRFRGAKNSETPDWLARDLQTPPTDSFDEESLPDSMCVGSPLGYELRSIVKGANGPWMAGMLSNLEWQSDQAGIESAHPFLDKRMIEFALAIPPNQRWQGGEVKRVIRNAMRPYLPKQILERNDKTQFEDLICEWVNVLVSVDSFVVNDLDIVKNELVQAEMVSELCSKFKAQYHSESKCDESIVWDLWRIIDVNEFLVQLDGVADG